MADIRERPRIRYDQDGPTRPRHYRFGQFGRDQRLARFVMLAQDHQVAIASTIHDLPQQFRVAATVDVLPFVPVEAARHLLETRPHHGRRLRVLLRRPGGNYPDLKRRGALSEYARQSRLVLPRERGRQCKAGGRTLALIQMHHQILQHRGFPWLALPSIPAESCQL